jgi:hypothetical protein
MLSFQTAVRFRMVCSGVLQRICGTAGDEAVAKAVAGLKLDAAESKAAVAAVHYILHSAVKYGVDSGVLVTELQQLGLPKGMACEASFVPRLTGSCVEHCDTCGRVFKEFQAAATAALEKRTPSCVWCVFETEAGRLTLCAVPLVQDVQWRTEVVVASSVAGAPAAAARVALQLSSGETVVFDAAADQLLSLAHGAWRPVSVSLCGCVCRPWRRV